MQNSSYFLAFDLGATSGRAMLASFDGNKVECREISRFPNQILRVGNKYYWNIFNLFAELKKALRLVASEHIQLTSIGIDTWGVDFVYVGDDGSLLGLPRAYRDPYTRGIPEEFFMHLSQEKVYEKTGIQVMDFNSLFQLYAARREKSSAFAAAREILFMPDALAYLLTGNKVCEYSIASTSQMLDPYTRTWVPELLDRVGVSASMFAPLVLPGTQVGVLSRAIQDECAINPVPVVAVAGHDTASAVAAVPAADKHFAYLSSGTWSLMGIELDTPIINEQSAQLNFTNEGGVEGTIRYLKNITGLWLLEKCMDDWKSRGHAYTYAQIVEMARTARGGQFIVDPDAPDFAHPDHMTTAIADYCKNRQGQAPDTHAEFVRCIFDSLSAKYKQVLELLQQVSPFAINQLHIIGGGAQNDLLNQFTANAIQKPVIAGPAEATALGNIMVQAKCMGKVTSLAQTRDVIRASVALKTFVPEKDNE
ncbi:MAG: rhamnulokinase [Bacteroidales bacterium]|jgi:rhamnulokinase|nr:rhamnulokinase [Bacteroidales bacterium]